MVPIARKNLFVEKTRLLISVGGVAFAVLLVVVLWSLYRGWDAQVTTYINSVPADIWVAQDGSSDMFQGMSILSTGKMGRIQALREVEEVHRFLGRQLFFKQGDRELRTFLIGVDPKRGIGGPPRMVAGKTRPEKREIVVDEVFARTYGFKIGDTLEIEEDEEPFTIVGLSAGGNMMVYQYSFVDLEEAEKVMGMGNLANFFLVKLKDPSQAVEVAAKIEDRVGDVDALPRPRFLQINRRIVDDTFLPIILVLVAIGFAVGVAVIGLTIYTATIEKSREYGVLKALGATNGQLFALVLEQSLISGLLGYVVGVVWALGVIALAERTTASFVTLVQPGDLIGILGLALAMSLVAAYIPVQRLVRIDPALVFRS